MARIWRELGEKVKLKSDQSMVAVLTAIWRESLRMRESGRPADSIR